MSVRAPVGPVNLCPIEACIGRGLAAIRPSSKTDTDFIFYYLESIQSEIAGTEGAVFASINKAQIADLRCPVPPLEEQKRIVALLDAATARVTELTACYEQARTHANDLLESSLLELFAGAFESQPKRKMGEVLQIARGGSPRPISEYITKSPNGVNWIKIGDASSSTKYIYETAQKIKPEGVSRSRMVYPGDFLLSNSMSFGRPYIMKTEGCIHDGWLVLRDSKGELDQDFLFYMLGSRFMYKRFSQLAAGSTVQNLNSALVSSIEIPVPPIDFQKRIAEKARLLEENVARLNGVNEIRLQHANDLRQSILEAAFAGEL
jgi:type I restriction enzyme S subunit